MSNENDSPACTCSTSSPEKKIVGHQFLAKLGKTRLRPGGKKATDWLIEKAQFTQDFHVLEVACNMATTAIEIAKKYQCNITAIDMNEKALSQAKQNIKKAGVQHLITLLKTDANQLPFEDNSFDVVINEAMLTMYPDKAKERLLKEYRRVLKPGGKLLTHDLTINTPSMLENITSELTDVIHMKVQPKLLSEWPSFLKQQGFSHVDFIHGKMTLMSPKGMIYDEGVLGTLRIIKNALKKENRSQFKQMFSMFRQNKPYLDYIAVCSSK